ncbi:MAG TPA: BT_3928 family protein [Flavisolibacter sp.]
MKAAVNIVRVLVAVLFIVSGLVKANDPLGLSYKMEEFFEIWNASLSSGSFLVSILHTLNEYSLSLSLLMIGLEIMAGVALLLGWKPKWVLSLLLILIIFFTFLTGYAYFSGKFKNCGCFGDCLPITPLTSFIKDVVLLVFIAFLAWKHRYINAVFSKRREVYILVASLMLTIAFQWHVLTFLPLVDCLPFKKGASIQEGMKIPSNAITDSFAMKFIYKKEGKQFEFAPEELPADLGTYTFVDRTEKLVRQGNAEPAIKSFSLTSLDGKDYTSSILEEEQALLLFVLDFEGAEEWIGDFSTVYQAARKKGVPIFIVSSEGARGKILVSGLLNEEVVFLNCDRTAIRTAARVNPTLYLLSKGRVIEKEGAAKLDYITARL